MLSIGERFKLVFNACAHPVVDIFCIPLRERPWSVLTLFVGFDIPDRIISA